MKNNHMSAFVNLVWEMCCLTSIVGIWPRFVEPSMLTTTQHSLKIDNLPKNLCGLKILQFSDLHFHNGTSQKFLNKIIKKIHKFSPDIIMFTGDFLCYSKLENSARLLEFLNALSAPYGCYAVLGNHDYAQKIGVNADGEYDLSEKNSSEILVGLKRLLYPVNVTGKISERARTISDHQALLNLLENSNFEVLNNRSKLIPIGNSALNLCGVGEYMIGQCKPEQAFTGWKSDFPGIVLAHNPDAIPMLLTHPGNMILSGHTHGGQVNLPGIWRRFTLMENPQYKKGLFNIKDKWVYINRGVGSTLPFRWFAVPEITLITWERA